MNICELLENSNTQASEDASTEEQQYTEVEQSDAIKNLKIDTQGSNEDSSTTDSDIPNLEPDENKNDMSNKENNLDNNSDEKSDTDGGIEMNTDSISSESNTSNQEENSDNKMLMYLSIGECLEEDKDNQQSADSVNNYLTNEELNNQQIYHLLNSSLFSSTNNSNNAEEESSNGNRSNEQDENNQNNIDFGHSILSSNSSVDNEFNFDRLGPFEKLCSLCDNPTPSNMESAAKYIVPALEFCSTQDDFMRVFAYLRKYCFFSDVLLRSLWLEQLQNIIQYIHQEGENIPVEFKDNFNMPNEIALLISDLMHEPTYQVKKYATASLLCIVERQLLNNDQIERIIIPSLLSLVKENNEDFHIDCISLFGKLAPLVGRELTTKYFLEPFCRLSTSPVFHTRKACASNITEIASIISTDEVEKYLIPHFCEFMKDQVWAIRKVCADIFSLFAVKCRRKTREQVLTEYFIRLLDDNSRWVKISAYKSLGSFIATFSKENTLPIDKEEAEVSENNQENVTEETVEKNTEKSENNEEKNSTEQIEEDNSVKTAEESTPTEKIEDKTSVEKIEDESSSESSNSPKKEGEYSNFIYWRNSIPSLDDQTTKETNEEKKEEINYENTEKDTENSKTISSTSNLATESKTNSIESIQITSKSSLNTNSLFSPLGQGIPYNNLYSSTNSLYSNLQQQVKSTDLNQLSEELKQDVVPSILLSYFITMVEMNAQNSLDAEMNYNCAFNFPAIALTLGLSNWKYVKNLYKKLAEDNNWKVRQTLAYSIHELALILGTECTQVELVPVFDSFIKDVDEVRMGIVSNLSKFLSVLSLEFRRSYMPKLNDFLKMDNQRNWRFRNELGLQIAEFCELFPADCVAEYIQPVTFILALDKVAEVRVTSIKALTIVLKQFEIHNEEKYRRNFLDDVIRTFADNNKWSFRQLFVVLCENILKEKAYRDLDSLSTDLFPKLFSLKNDAVANIRVCLARVVSNQILNLEYFTSYKNQISTELDTLIESFKKDKENDVRSYFSQDDDSSDQMSSLPPYEDIVNNQNYINCQNKETDTSNSESNKSALNEYQIQNDCRLNDSLNLINTQVMNYDNTEDVELEEEDDEDDDDEIIDTTKVGQLKIVNELDNDMEDSSDEIIDTSPHSPDVIPMKTEASPEATIHDIEFPAPLVDTTKVAANKEKITNSTNENMS